MPRLIRVFAERTCHFVGFVMRLFKLYLLTHYSCTGKFQFWASTHVESPVDHGAMRTCWPWGVRIRLLLSVMLRGTRWDRPQSGQIPVIYSSLRWREMKGHKLEKILLVFEPCHEKTCFWPMRTTKTQISLRISTFVVRFLDSIMPILAKSQISRLASLCSWAGQFESYLVGNPKDGFSCDRAHVIKWISKFPILWLMLTK